eukprot:8427603-Lingulodinium_polyedra.AAC.1
MQRQKLYYARQAERQGVDTVPSEVLDFTVAVACANHDCQNAIKWSPTKHCEDGLVQRNLFIAIAASRN